MARPDRWLMAACISGVLGCWLVIALTMGGCGSEGDYDGGCVATITGNDNEVNQNCNEAGRDGSQDNSDDHSETTNEAPPEHP